MKKKHLLSCAIFLIVSLSPYLAKAQTAEQIVDHYLEISGGRNAYARIQKVSSKLQGSFLGSSIHVAMEAEYPNKVKSYMLMNGNETQREEFDGQTGFVVENGVKRELTYREQGQYKFDKLFLPELYYKEHGIVLKYLGKHRLKKYSGEFHKVQFQTPAGTYSNFYYDTASGLLSRVEEKDGTYVHYSDFRKYEGFTVPYGFLFGNKLGIMKIRARVTSIELDYKEDAVMLSSSGGGSVSPPSSSSPTVTTEPVRLPTSATYGKKLALVLGNANYVHGGALKNPINDAKDMSARLQQLGFEVMYHQNRSQGEMKKAIDAFGQKLKGYDVGLFYYAGHGIQYKGRNYIIPVEANLKAEQQIEYDCIAADRILAFMEYAQSDVNIIILDACRNNPFERSWRRSADGQGLAFMNAPTGSLIAYATSPGTTASDGVGGNGLYTSALLKYMNIPGISIEQMFKRVRAEVEEKSGGKQVPWESTSLKGEFSFKQ